MFQIWTGIKITLESAAVYQVLSLMCVTRTFSLNYHNMQLKKVHSDTQPGEKESSQGPKTG
jgi:hypothetical protein